MYNMDILIAFHPTHLVPYSFLSLLHFPSCGFLLNGKYLTFDLLRGPSILIACKVNGPFQLMTFYQKWESIYWHVKMGSGGFSPPHCQSMGDTFYSFQKSVSAPHSEYPQTYSLLMEPFLFSLPPLKEYNCFIDSLRSPRYWIKPMHNQN